MTGRGKPGRALVFHTGAIGDLVLAGGGALSALRRRLREVRIEGVGYPERLSILQACGLLDAVHSIDSHHLFNLFAGAGGLPDATLAFFQDVSLVVSWVSDRQGNLKRNLEKAGVGRIILVDTFPPCGARTHVADHYAEALRPLGVRRADATRGLTLPEGVGEEARLEAGSLAKGGPVVGMLPGSGSPRKSWPRERFLELAQRLGDEAKAAIALFLGPAERERGDEEFWRRAREGMHLFVERPLVEVASLISKLDLFIGCDSGLSHLAAALGTPVIALFGPTDPRVWAPRGREVRVITGEGGDIEEINARTVLKAALEMLRARPQGP